MTKPPTKHTEYVVAAMLNDGSLIIHTYMRKARIKDRLEDAKSALAIIQKNDRNYQWKIYEITLKEVL